MVCKELEYFHIEGALGGSQDWFSDWSMHFGGCAAITACDLCIYLAIHRERTELYPFDKSHLTRRDFLTFGRQMKPYLRPRAHGVDKLSLYTDGITGYWRDCGVRDLSIQELPGETAPLTAWQTIRSQLDMELPIPYLLLKHRSRQMREYVWHWFILAGYQEEGCRRLVKAVTYGESEWLDFNELWDTGYLQKGGAILVRLPDPEHTEGE